jgi:hypothetical protein
MRFKSGSHGIPFTNVKLLTVRRFLWADEQVDTSLLKFLTHTNLGVNHPWKNQRFSNPVGSLNNPQAIWIAVGNKNSQ